MTQATRIPMMKIPLGLKPSEGITYGKLLKRSRMRLRLLHSGQPKVDFLVQGDYLSGARLIVENDEFVLMAPIHGPVQGDFLGYPGDADSSSVAAVNSPELSQPSTVLGEGEQDLGALLDAVTAGDVGLAIGALPLTPPRLAPAQADRLAVDQVVACAEASSNMLSALVDICATSDDVIADTRRLERLTGLNSAPARHYIAAREPELVADIDGHRVPFCAPAVRIDAVEREGVRIKVHLLQTRSENDILRAEVMDAVGTGVPGGVATLGEHDLRFVGLEDWQRGVLLILRGAGVPLSLSVTEAISTARLARRPAVVVGLGNWSELRRAAVHALSAFAAPVPADSADVGDAGVESPAALGCEAA